MMPLRGKEFPPGPLKFSTNQSCLSGVVDVGALFAQLEMLTSRQKYVFDPSLSEYTVSLVSPCPAQKISSPVFWVRCSAPIFELGAFAGSVNSSVMPLSPIRSPNVTSPASWGPGYPVKRRPAG